MRSARGYRGTPPRQASRREPRPEPMLLRRRYAFAGLAAGRRPSGGAGRRGRRIAVVPCWSARGLPTWLLEPRQAWPLEITCHRVVAEYSLAAARHLAVAAALVELALDLRSSSRASRFASITAVLGGVLGVVERLAQSASRGRRCWPEFRRLQSPDVLPRLIDPCRLTSSLAACGERDGIATARVSKNGGCGRIVHNGA